MKVRRSAATIQYTAAVAILVSLCGLFTAGCLAEICIQGDTGQQSDAHPDTWIIRDSSAGPVILKKRIPQSLVNNSDDLEKQYFATYIADSLIFEGFAFKNPPLKVGISNGPFSRWENINRSEQPLLNDLARSAVRDLKRKVYVNMIVIESGKITTREGIGVGSTLSNMRRAYGDIYLHPVPPTFSGDCCAANTKKLRNVFFYFSDCDKAEEGGKVIRIMIFEQ